MARITSKLSPEPAAAPVRIRLFAGLREQAGWAERHWLIPGDSAEEPTPRQLWWQLQLPGDVATMRVAINQEFADLETGLQPGDELAFLPPISGG